MLVFSQFYSSTTSIEQLDNSKQTINFPIISPTFPKFHTKIALPLTLFSLMKAPFSSLMVTKMVSVKSHMVYR